jgi:hypothetical protein
MMAGFEVLPPTLLVILNHPWLGAATLGGVLATSAVHSWMIVRSDRDRHRAMLSYAQDTTNMGGDPSSVIAALQRGADSDGEPAQLTARDHEPDRHHGGQPPPAVWSQRPPHR